MTSKTTLIATAALLAGLMLVAGDTPRAAKTNNTQPAKGGKYDPTAHALAEIAGMKVGKHDWPMWMGWSHKNNTPHGKGIPTDWNVKTGKNIKWKAKLGTQTYGNAVVANGRVYVGTNNRAGYVKRYPSARIDLGCLLCFDEKTGKFLWQHSTPKIPAGRVNDWPLQGICDAPFVDGERLWYVTSRGEVVCLDTRGFHDGVNDGPFKAEPVKPRNPKDSEGLKEADVVWKYDMMKTLGIFQHNMCSCSVMVVGDVVFVNTSNGVDASHVNIPAPNAPSFLALNKNTGELLWTDKSPGKNILHGQWSSPTHAVIKGQPMVFFAGGDGWLYCFDPKGGSKGKSKLLWKFDCNPKVSKWILSGRGTRNNLIATPVVYDGLVYIAVGQDPEHGNGNGHLWCIDPTKKLDGSDVSPTLAVDKMGKPLSRRRWQAIDSKMGEKAIKNPNSAVVWHYDKLDRNGDGTIDEDEYIHRSCGTVAIKNDILIIADFAGFVNCLHAKTGKVHWVYDMFSGSWGSPLIVEGKVYIGNETGEVAIFPLTTDPKKALKMGAMGPEPAINTVNVVNSVYTTPIVANNVLYITNKNTLYAISKDGK